MTKDDLRYLESASILAMQSVMRRRGQFKLLKDENLREESFKKSSETAWLIAFSMLDVRNRIKKAVKDE